MFECQLSSFQNMNFQFFCSRKGKYTLNRRSYKLQSNEEREIRQYKPWHVPVVVI